MKKDTVYIDVEDEITTITEKVQSAKADVVALVLPKRCTTLQSSVNMKILHKGADAAGKKVVLITSEQALMPIAATTGFYVAKTLQSKPMIPKEDIPADSDTEPVHVDAEDVNLDETKSIGELAADGADEDSTIALDAPAIVAADTVKKSKGKKVKPDKKLKVPNFESFRVKLFSGVGLLILLVVLWVVMARILPKATITIVTENRTMAVESSATGEANAKSPDVENKILPMTLKSIDKQETAKTPATGTKNVGTKATGSITIYNCDYSDGFTIPAGTVFSTGASGGTASFVSNDAVVVPKFTGSSSTCKITSPYTGSGKATVAVSATTPGASYNLSAGRTFSIQGIPSDAKISAVGGPMGGGEDKTVKVVSDQDCTTAKNQVNTVKSEEYTKQLTEQMKSSGLVPVSDSFLATSPAPECTPAVGSEATEVTATATYKYSMQGVDKAGLDAILRQQAVKDLNDPTQDVLSTGIDTAQVTTTAKPSATEYDLQVKSTATVGIKQDADKIAEAIKGKKQGTTYDIIRSTPGVKDVTVDYSPFWVRSTPKNTKKITIVFQKDVTTEKPAN